MNLFDPDNWPLWVVSAGMILAGVIDGWIRKVPNWLTLSLVLSGWLLGLLHTLDIRPDGNGVTTGIGGIGESLLCTLIGFLLLFPLLFIKAMGAGDVKMQMGFGAWVGAFFGPIGWQIVIIAFCVGAIVGGVIGLGMMVVNRSYQQNAENMRGILADALVEGSVKKMADRGQSLREKGPKLPYGIPLCIGFVGYLYYLYY